jgi:signal transduction histidine kinase
LKNDTLAGWLQAHINMLGYIDDPHDNSFHQVLYEGVINILQQGETGLLDSLLATVATQAAAKNRGLTSLLTIPVNLRRRIWYRIGEEVDPEPAFAMLNDLDLIFEHIRQVITDSYLEAHQFSPIDNPAELTRLQSESEQKVMEYAAEMARANRELARLEKAKTDFISIAAHELKTPLTLIQGYVNMLFDMKITPEIESFVTGIQRGSLRMGQILENMLDLSAIDTNQVKLVLTPVNLQSLFSLIIEQQQQALRQREQAIETMGLSSLPWLEADQTRLHQAFTHLINNAIKYTPDGGKIKILGETLPATNSRPESVRIKIQDTGVGIAPEERDKIFERFHRTGNAKLHSTSQIKFMGAGPGLGLAIVKGMVEAHRGRVWADSPGFDVQNFPGSAFNVILPVNLNTAKPGKIKRLKKLSV